MGRPLIREHMPLTRTLCAAFALSVCPAIAESQSAPAPKTLGLSVPAADAGTCVLARLSPRMAALHPNDTAKRRVAVIPDDSRGNWMYVVMRDSLRRSTTVVVTHFAGATSGTAAITSFTAMIDPSGAMWGMDMDALRTQFTKSAPRPDAAAIFAAGRAARFALDSEDQTTVRALIAWYDKRCPAK